MTSPDRGRPWLLDVNILMGLSWPEVQIHERCRNWMAKHRASGIATCPLTQMGFVRIASLPKNGATSTTPTEAARILTRVTNLAEHVFWPASLSWAEVEAVHGQLRGHRQLTDAYLVALARANGGRLLTLDRGVLTLRGAEGVVELLA